MRDQNESELKARALQVSTKGNEGAGELWSGGESQTSLPQFGAVIEEFQLA